MGSNDAMLFRRSYFLFSSLFPLLFCTHLITTTSDHHMKISNKKVPRHHTVQKRRAHSAATSSAAGAGSGKHHAKHKHYPNTATPGGLHRTNHHPHPTAPTTHTAGGDVKMATHPNWMQNASLTKSCTNPSPVENQFRTTRDPILPSRPFSMATARPDELRDGGLHDLNSMESLRREQLPMRSAMGAQLNIQLSSAPRGGLRSERDSELARQALPNTKAGVKMAEGEVITASAAAVAEITPMHVDVFWRQINNAQQARSKEIERLDFQDLAGGNEGQQRRGGKGSHGGESRRREVAAHAGKLFAGSMNTSLPSANANRNKQIFAGLYDV